MDTIQKTPPGSCSPADGTPLEQVTPTAPEAVRQVVDQARAAQPAWEALSLKQRSEYIKQLGRRILERRDEVVAILVQETGKSAAECLMNEVAGVAEFIKSTVKVAKTALKPEKIPISRINYPGKKVVVEAVARGVIGIIAPWNYPLSIFYKPLFPALLAGNGVVLKPSEHTPRTGAWLAEQCAAVLPKGLVGCIQGAGDVGQALLDGGVDGVVFTGSVRTGRRVAQAAAERLIPCSVELGGKDAAIVLADCNFERTVVGIAQWAMHNAGHNCAGIERVLVEEAIADRFVETLGRLLSKLQVAPEPGASLGPIQNEQQLRIVEEHVAQATEAGAKLVTGGERTGKGLGYRPTLLDNCTREMKVVAEETFGPVIAVTRVKNADEAVRVANDSEFGLNGSVWTTDLKRGAEVARRLDVGVALVNNHCVTGIMPETPWTGVKNTGTGVASSRHSYSTYVRRRTILIDKNSKPDPWWVPLNDDIQTMGELISRYSLGSLASGLKMAGLLGKRIKAIRDLVANKE